METNTLTPQSYKLSISFLFLLISESEVLLKTNIKIIEK